MVKIMSFLICEQKKKKNFTNQTIKSNNMHNNKWNQQGKKC